MNHIFKVGTGLDSQILGDFEIIAQLNNSFLRSKKLNAVNPSFERLFNMIKHASKRIKNETKISSGATSVSYAAVRYILDNISDLTSKRILLFGTGKIGRNTCENLVKHTSNKHITLINRSEEKAKLIAGKFVEIKPLAEQGNVDAQHVLGVMYANGRGVMKDEKKAVKWYQLAAERGLAEAQFNLSLMYDNGQGVIEDDKMAVKWLRLAAQQGLAEAQCNLAIMYNTGEGVIQDYQEAVKWFRLAAEQGIANAQFSLGNM